MSRHIYDWNIVACDVNHQLTQTQLEKVYTGQYSNCFRVLVFQSDCLRPLRKIVNESENIVVPKCGCRHMYKVHTKMEPRFNDRNPMEFIFYFLEWGHRLALWTGPNVFCYCLIQWLPVVPGWYGFELPFHSHVAIAIVIVFHDLFDLKRKKNTFFIVLSIMVII